MKRFLALLALVLVLGGCGCWWRRYTHTIQIEAVWSIAQGREWAGRPYRHAMTCEAWVYEATGWKNLKSVVTDTDGKATIKVNYGGDVMVRFCPNMRINCWPYVETLSFSPGKHWVEVYMTRR